MPTQLSSELLDAAEQFFQDKIMPDQQSSDRQDAIAQLNHRWGGDSEDMVIYNADDVGKFADGCIVMADDDRFGLWNVNEFEKVRDPYRFDYRRGIWLGQYDIDDEILQLLSEPVPESNKPLAVFDA